MSSLTGLLVGTSAMLAIRMEEPGVEITPQEAGSFMKAAQNVARHYSVETTQRTLDWVAFVGVSCSVFGTRFLTVVNNSAKRRRSGAGATVVGMDGAPIRPSPTNGKAPPQDPPEYRPSTPQGPEDYGDMN